MKLKQLESTKTTSLLLRVGLAFVFFYAAVGSLQHPVEWVGYLPTFLISSTHATQLLRVFAVIEIVLAVWLLVGKYVRYAALLAAALLIGIVIAQPDSIIITFRDIGLVFMALALASLKSQR